MTTVEALKSLYTAMGGNLEDVTNISTNPDMINALCDVASGGNPNTVETITGTVAEPWGGRFAEIKAGIADGSMTCYFNGSTGGRMYVFLDNANGHVIATDIANYDQSMNTLVLFGGEVYIYNLTDGSLAKSYVVDEGEVLGEPVTPTMAKTLTIIYHPMPDNA